MIYLQTLLGVLVFTVVGLAAGWVFREMLVLITSRNTGKFLRTAPLTASFGMLVIAIYIFCAVFAPLIAPYGQAEILSGGFEPWSSTYILGTDNLGRDVFTRLIYGARNTVGIAFQITAVAFLIGTMLGIFAALKGGIIDQVMS